MMAFDSALSRLVALCSMMGAAALSLHVSGAERSQVTILLKNAVAQLRSNESNEASDYLLFHAAQLCATNGCASEVTDIANRISDMHLRSQLYHIVARIQTEQKAYADARRTLDMLPDMHSGSAFARVLCEVLDSEDADANKFISIANEGVKPTAKSLALLGDIPAAIDQFNQLHGMEVTLTKRTAVQVICKSLAKGHKIAAAVAFLNETTQDYRDECLSRVTLELANSADIAQAYELLLGMQDVADQRLFSRAVNAIRVANAKRTMAFYELDTTSARHELTRNAAATISRALSLADVESERGHYDLGRESLVGLLDVIVALDNSGGIRDVSSPKWMRFTLLNRLAHSATRARDMSSVYRVAKRIGDEYGELWYVRILQDVAYLVEHLFNDPLCNALDDEQLDPLALVAINTGRAAAILGVAPQFAPLGYNDDFAWTTIINSANSRVNVQNDKCDRQIRLGAMRILSEVDSIEVAQPILEGLLKSDPDVVVRVNAARSIKRVGMVTVSGRAALEAALADDSLDVRLAAAEGLTASVASDKAVCKVLRLGLLQADWYYQAQAARVASSIFGRARSILTELRQVREMANRDYTLFYVARAMLCVDDDPTNAVPMLEQLLKSDDLWVAAKAAQSIGDLGPAASLSAGCLRRVANGRRDDYLRLHVAEALWRIAPEREEAGSILRGIVESDSSPNRVRRAAIALLKRIGWEYRGQGASGKTGLDLGMKESYEKIYTAPIVD